MTENKNTEKEIPVDFLEGEEKVPEQERESIKESKHAKETSKRTKKSKGELKKKSDEFKRKYEELNEQFLRIRAEFANYKKRVERDQAEFSIYLRAEVIKNFLSILDDFDHMIQKTENNVNEESILEGAKMIYEKFIQVLKDYGVEKIEALDTEFDPQIHEAMMMQKIDDQDKNGKVINVFQEGYRMNERLLRPSKVIVGDYQQAKEDG